MTKTVVWSRQTIGLDLLAGLVVALVALPLCLGVALASDAPLFAGLVSGILGGVVVGSLSGSHTSVSGPAAGLTAVVATQIASLGSFPAFLLALVVAGVLQVLFGAARAGFLADFIPSGVIKGLLAAIGIILILKQIPHLLGHDTDPEGEMSFAQPDHENTFSELGELIFDIHPGAAVIGCISLILLFLWDSSSPLRRIRIPAPLLVVVMSVMLVEMLRRVGGVWEIQPNHLVQVPVTDRLVDMTRFVETPDWSQWRNPAIYSGGLMIAVVASLETLLNLEAVDRIDPRKRNSPPSRELVAQGIGNLAVGLLGGIPVTSVIVRSSVNLNANARSKLATITHGLFLLGSVVFLPQWLNRIPLSCLAAILLAAGWKLASPKLVVEMWREGRYQFLPFAFTVLAIIFTDLLVGVLLGLGVSIAFILNSNLRQPIRQIMEKHLGGNVLHIVLANQVSFLNRAALVRALDQVPRGGHVLLDAQHSDYIDPDILGLIRDFRENVSPARGVEVSLLGFRPKYGIPNQLQYVDYSTRELQSRLTPEQVLQVLKDGHARFRSGQRLTRDLGRQVAATAEGQHPLAVVLSCIDSRTPAELIFDLGVGDVFSVRIAGNVFSPKVLGSIEYGCGVAGAKLILVMGHTRCGAVTAAVHGLTRLPEAGPAPSTHVEAILGDIRSVCQPGLRERWGRASSEEQMDIINRVAQDNVRQTMAAILRDSHIVCELITTGKLALVGAMYDVSSGDILYLSVDKS